MKNLAIISAVAAAAAAQDVPPPLGAPPTDADAPTDLTPPYEAPVEEEPIYEPPAEEEEEEEYLPEEEENEYEHEEEEDEYAHEEEEDEYEHEEEEYVDDEEHDDYHHVEEPVDEYYAPEPTPDAYDAPAVDYAHQDYGYEASDECYKKVEHVYEAPAQKDCGVLYADVLDHWLKVVLKHIDQEVIDHIVELVKKLVDHVNNLKENPDAVYDVVECVKEISDYCGEHLPDDDAKYKVADAMTECQQAYEHIEKLPVTKDVKDGFYGSWDACKKAPEEHKEEYVKEFHDCYTGYLKDGHKSEDYHQHIEKLKECPDEDVAYQAEELDAKVKALSVQEEAAVEAATAGAGSLVAPIAGAAIVAAVLF